MLTPDRTGFDTLTIHAGARPDAVTGSHATPIHRTAAFVLPDAGAASAIIRQAAPGYVDSLLANPTVAVFEERIAALEGGVAAIATGSGQAALHLAICTLAGAGDHIVAAHTLNTRTHALLTRTMPRFGVTTTLVDPRDHDAIAAAIRPQTRLVLGETISGAALTVLDIPAVAQIAHDAGVPLLVDSTATSPALCQPLDHGADLVLHSAGELIGGHGTALGGILVDGGRVDWVGSGRFDDLLVHPCEAFGGLSFVDEYGPSAFAARARAEGLVDFGGIMAPDAAWALIQGCQTLSVRMTRHVANASAVASHLAGLDIIESITHPGLPDHPDHALTSALMPLGAGTVVWARIRGGRHAAAALVDAVELWSHLTVAGDVRSTLTHPASTTHHHLTDDQLSAAGLDEGLVRLSVGLEDPDDLIRDLDQALRRAAKVAA